MPIIQVLKVFYYLAAIVFHLLLFFTNTGNYFHGGTPLELIVLEGYAILIAVSAIKLWKKVGKIEKFFVTICAVVPVAFVGSSVISFVTK